MQKENVLRCEWIFCSGSVHCHISIVFAGSFSHARAYFLKRDDRVCETLSPYVCMYVCVCVRVRVNVYIHMYLCLQRTCVLYLGSLFAKNRCSKSARHLIFKTHTVVGWYCCLQMRDSSVVALYYVPAVL